MIKRLARGPYGTLNRLLHSLGLPNSTPPPSAGEALFRQYGRLARRIGLDKLYVVLSFDCDTPEDIPAAEQVDHWLRERGVQATYAVPGAQLQQGAQVYRRIADAGAHFINHGALPHAEWREGRYWSTTFYRDMSPQAVAEDIRRGHAIFSEVLDRMPAGFRAPHFGNFQAPEQRAIPYATLKELGYCYSTSTNPELALEYGPVLDVGGLAEIPVSGSFASPRSILDSWSFIESPYRPIVQDRYAELFIQTVERLLALGVPGVLNYYVDPAHVYQAEAFYRAVEYLIARGVPTLHFDTLLKMVKPTNDQKDCSPF